MPNVILMPKYVVCRHVAPTLHTPPPPSFLGAEGVGLGGCVGGRVWLGGGWDRGLLFPIKGTQQDLNYYFYVTKQT